MIKELILTTMFSFAPLINGVSPSKADVFFSSSESETSEEAVTLDDGKTYRKVYDAQSNDVNSVDDLIDGNVYLLVPYLSSGLWLDDYIYSGWFTFNFYDFFTSESVFDYLVINETLIEAGDNSPYIFFDFNDGSYFYLNYYTRVSLGYDIGGAPTYQYATYELAVKPASIDVSTFENGIYSIGFYIYYSSEQQYNFIDNPNWQYGYTYFHNAGDNIPYHYEEIVKGNTLFDIINDWFYSLFNNDQMNSYTLTFFGQEITMTQYLCNVATIVTLCLMVAFLFSVTIFLFKCGAGLFKW